VTKWVNMEKPSFTMPFNVTGFPAISVCTGFGEGGLPISMQLAGKPFTEPTVFRAAHAYESAMPWRGRRPALTD
jgi:aspartyl-tRNA(Asn)/glutamyl-tRNA(Gln) amidotransferase subunit A